MNDNFNINNEQEDDMFTEAFTRNNDPARVANEAARREYSNILAQSQQQERTVQESYSDLYQRAQQASFRRRQATPSRGFTGGMEAQQQNAASAAEIQQLGNIGRGREEALREIRAGRQSAFSNALIAGQQQADYARMLQDASTQRQGQIESIVASDDYDDEAKRRLLKDFGIADEEVNRLLGISIINNRAIRSARKNPLQVYNIPLETIEAAEAQKAQREQEEREQDE